MHDVDHAVTADGLADTAKNCGSTPVAGRSRAHEAAHGLLLRDAQHDGECVRDRELEICFYSSMMAACTRL